MAVKKMGFEALLYYGAAGSIGTTQITNSRDIKYTVTPKTGETTVRGAGSSPPITTKRVVGFDAQLTWQMIDKSDDATLTALLAAARTGAPVALRYLPHSAAVGFDGDVILTVDNGAPLSGENTFDFTAEPNDDTRTPLINA